MVQSQFSVSCDSYKTSICNGFSALQQSGEFVDMTLAADGHLVKVHQAIVALASPYLKSLLSSVPCQHPVIFLNNVSHKSLCLLLDYIYTGETVVPADYLVQFMDTAKALRIKGLENMANENTAVKMALNKYQVPSETSFASKSFEVDVPQVSKLSEGKRDISDATIKYSRQTRSTSVKDDSNDFDTDDNGAQDDFDDSPMDYNTDIITTDRSKNISINTSNLQYSMSIRGSLQMILNRYVYNLNSRATRAGLRRWRCVDYRNRKCMAFVVTKDNMIVNRANMHNHPFHDKKILGKIHKNAIFAALEDAENYKEKEDDTKTDTDEPQSEFVSIEYGALPDLSEGKTQRT